MSEIRTQFNLANNISATAPDSLSEYYRGASPFYVSDVPSNSGIPTSGTISLGDFIGAGGYFNTGSSANFTAGVSGDLVGWLDTTSFGTGHDKTMSGVTLDGIFEDQVLNFHYLAYNGTTFPNWSPSGWYSYTYETYLWTAPPTYHYLESNHATNYVAPLDYMYWPGTGGAYNGDILSNGSRYETVIEHI
jgi:hypothetical protein